MDYILLNKFIKQFRALLAIVLLCVIGIVSLVTVTVTEESKALSLLTNLSKFSIEFFNFTSRAVLVSNNTNPLA